MASLEKALVNEIKSIVKIFPIFAQQGTATPYSTYILITDDRQRTLNENHTGNIEEVHQIDIFSNTYSSLKTLKTSVINKLKAIARTTISSVYVQDLAVTNTFTLYEDDTQLYRAMIEFKTYYKEE